MRATQENSCIAQNLLPYLILVKTLIQRLVCFVSSTLLLWCGFMRDPFRIAFFSCIFSRATRRFDRVLESEIQSLAFRIPQLGLQRDHHENVFRQAA